MRRPDKLSMVPDLLLIFTLLEGNYTTLLEKTLLQLKYRASDDPTLNHVYSSTVIPYVT